MVLGIYFFFKGYVRAEIKGRLKERVINRCVRSGVFMWNVKTDADKISFNIRSCDIDRVKASAEGEALTISDKSGFPYIAGRFRRRYALVFGTLFFVALTVFLASLVWNINITGCKVTDVDDIERILKDNGVYRWCFKRAVDEDFLEVRIMNGLDTLSWINVEVKGTSVNVRVKERRAAPEIIGTDATDLVASKDGVISELRIKNGEEAVKRGDTVVKGQLLVSALVERDGDYILEQPYTVHSWGEVIARTWYTFDIKQPTFEEKREYTGRGFTRKRIGIAGFDIDLYFKSSIPYEEYEIISKKYGGLLGVESETVREIKTLKQEYTVTEALSMAVSKAESQLPDGVLTKMCLTKEYTEGDGFVDTHIVFECTENIALETPYKERRETIDDSKDSEIQ